MYYVPVLVAIIAYSASIHNPQLFVTRKFRNARLVRLCCAPNLVVFFCSLLLFLFLIHFHVFFFNVSFAFIYSLGFPCFNNVCLAQQFLLSAAFLISFLFRFIFHCNSHVSEENVMLHFSRHNTFFCQPRSMNAPIGNTFRKISQFSIFGIQSFWFHYLFISFFFASLLIFDSIH